MIVFPLIRLVGLNLGARIDARTPADQTRQLAHLFTHQSAAGAATLHVTGHEST